MSNLLPAAEGEECAAAPKVLTPPEALPDRMVKLGDLEVHRVLPVRGRRLIGPWCFFDRYGPLSFTGEKPMDVAPHPHIGLQTVTWLLSGEVVHNDSLGNECLVRPGQLSLMTAGRGIAHTEETPRDNSGKLDGVQFWVALPDAHREMAPQYQCTREQPVVELPGGIATVVLGEFAGGASAGTQLSPGVGACLAVHPGGRLCVPLRPDFEYGVLLAGGTGTLPGTQLQVNTLYYLGMGRGEIELRSETGATVLLIGGPPFGETILMWWNFVARNAEEIAAARERWQAHELFGAVPRYEGPRIEAPQFLGRPIGSR